VLSRSEQMSRIRGRNTSPEILLRKALWSAGLRYRLHARTAGCRPDISIISQKLAIFIDGCFWHGCPEHYVRPRSRNAFWDQKLFENINRDRRQTDRLEAEGWTVCRIWEHEIRESVEVVTERVLSITRGSAPSAGPSWRVVKVEFLDPLATREKRYLEDLRDPALQMSEERKRSTRKVGRIPQEK